MFDVAAAVPDPLPAATAAVRGLVVAPDDAGRIEQITRLEELKRATSAAQARITAALVVAQREAQRAAGVPAERVGRGVAEQVALARRESPRRGGRFVGTATALAHEMPRTLEALAEGSISEWGATCLVRETAVLQVEDRREVDARLQPVLAAPGTSEGDLIRAAQSLAHELDAAAAVRRAARATADRRVTIRPAPDAMVHVTALLPVAEGVATYAALHRAAASASAGGDPRGRGQVMADTLVGRVTGRDPVTEPVGVTVDLVMTDEALLAGRPDAAQVRGRGQVPVPVPAAVARRLVAEAGAAGRAWLRRLWTSPDGSALAAMDSRSRRFPAGLARLVALADQSCRTPWCDAPVLETDHAVPHAEGGATSGRNAQGLCRRCNLAKQAHGWLAARAPDGSVTTTTPTGHRYTSVRPPVLGRPPGRAAPVVDLQWAVAGWHRSRAG